MLCSGGGQLDGLREPHLGGNAGDSHMSVCHVKRMAATLRTVSITAGRAIRSSDAPRAACGSRARRIMAPCYVASNDSIINE